MTLAKVCILNHRKRHTDNIRQAQHCDNFSWTHLILAIILVAVFASLGTWQFKRAKYKEQLLAQMQQRIRATPIKLDNGEQTNFANSRFYPISVVGEYINQYTFLLDNQVFNSRPGFRVLTIFAPHNTDAWLLIDRGWIARAIGQGLPTIAQVFGPQNIDGIINRPATGVLLKKDTYDLNVVWPRVLQSLDFELIKKYIDHPLYDFTIQLNEDAVGAEESTPISFGVSPAKHIGYCIQWFAFAGLALMYYVISSFKRN